jgi:hypothetical protein
VIVEAPHASFEGHLTVPGYAQGIVRFAHDSGLFKRSNIMSDVLTEVRRAELERRGAIVVVDDDARTRRAVLERIQTQFGDRCEVHRARDTQEAANLLKSLRGERNVEVPVVAIAMRVVLGEPAGPTIREYVSPETKIIAYAEVPVGQMRDRAITAGASACVHIDDVEAVVHDAFLEKELGGLDLGFAPVFSFVS